MQPLVRTLTARKLNFHVYAPNETGFATKKYYENFDGEYYAKKRNSSITYIVLFRIFIADCIFILGVPSDKYHLFQITRFS